MKREATQAIVELHLKELKLPGMLRAYESILREAQEQSHDPLKFLAACLSAEADNRKENRLRARMKEARFSTLKTVTDYDFSAIPKLDKGKIISLCGANFVGEKENVVLVGNPGTGKTHIATSIGLGAIEAGQRVRFTCALNLSQELELARKEHRLPRYIKSFDKFHLVIIDELGYLGLGPGGELLFQFLAERYERRSVVITTNLEFSRWVEVFSDPALTTALLDRLTHHCHVISFEGESYRFRQSQEAIHKAKSKR